MNKVKFSSKTELNKNELKEILKGRFKSNHPVVIKLHFGEPGNPNAFTPKDIQPLIEALNELNFEVVLTDTPVTYSSPRNSKAGYEKVVKDRGYGELNARSYIEDQYVDQEVGDLKFEVAKILADAENLIILSHVKGHECAGFGGAIKNLGMGALSAKTKAMIHDVSKPVVNEDLCVGCGLCASHCPAGAINIEEGKANPNLNACWGCSICQIVCPEGALTPKKKSFDEALAMGAVAAIKLMPKSTFYINVIKNISKACDCEGGATPILAKDLGTIYAETAVLADQASIDLLRKANNYDVFEKANHKDPNLQIKFAADHANLNREYELT